MQVHKNKLKTLYKHEKIAIIIAVSFYFMECCVKKNRGKSVIIIKTVNRISCHERDFYHFNKILKISRLVAIISVEHDC